MQMIENMGDVFRAKFPDVIPAWDRRSEAWDIRQVVMKEVSDEEGSGSFIGNKVIMYDTMGEITEEERLKFFGAAKSLTTHKS